MSKANILPQKDFVEKLKGEYADILREELKKKGYESDHILENDKLIIAYCTLFERRVESKPRKVHLSTTLAVDDSVKDGFEDLIKKFENGADVNPHLSTLTAKLDKTDKMFFDWGINHFHLGTEIMKNGFVKRTGPVAYTVVRDNDVYVVAVEKHGHWSDKNLLTIIDRDWPYLIQHARVEGTFEKDFNSQEIGELRNANVNVGVTLDNGHSYISPGLGYAGDGSWMQAVLRLIEINKIFQKIHRYFDEKLEINDAYKDNYGTHVDFTLKKIDNSIFIVEPNTQFQNPILVVLPLQA